jgi:hypothetical protein
LKRQAAGSSAKLPANSRAPSRKQRSGWERQQRSSQPDIGRQLSDFSEKQERLTARQQELFDTTRQVSDEAKSAASAAAASAEQAALNSREGQELLARLQSDHEGLSRLIQDLRNRIAALYVLAAPLPEGSGSEQPPGENA